MTAQPITTTFFALEELVKKRYNIDELELNEVYKIDGIKVETPEGFKNSIGFIRKQGKKATVEFESGLVHTCLVNHMFIPDNAPVLYAYNAKPGDKVLTKDGGVDIIKSVELTEEDMVAYDLSVDALDGVYVTADGLQHHNTGKTQTVEQVLHSAGLSDGHGYYKNTGSASAAGVYTLLYHHRKDIILFDDSDGALADQDARNIIKAATDTKKSRKLVWNKRSSFIFDPDEEDEDAYAGDLSMAPKHFNFEGRIIFISNLPLNKLDPDGALRTRAFVINVDPTDDELFEHMGKILYDIKLEDGLTLSKEERDHVFNIVKTSKKKSGVSLRKLVRALNIAASGAKNWETLVQLYS